MLMQLTTNSLDPHFKAAAPLEPADIVSIIVPVLRDDVSIATGYWTYKEALGAVDAELEFIYVLGQGATATLAALTRIKEKSEPLVIIVLSMGSSEAGMLRAGLQHARGETIVTLPGLPQIDPRDIPKVLSAVGQCDVALGRRAGLSESSLDHVQSTTFHWLVRHLFGRDFGDLVCRVRAYRRQVLEEIAAYSVPAHFVPLLAAERGFRLCEVDVREEADSHLQRTTYRRRLARSRLALDALALFVVLTFIRKPLRFCGALGLPILLFGAVFTAALGAARLLFQVPLADRPALILGVLMIVLGIQVLALGLIGEIIVFSTGKRIKDYTVEKIL